MTFEKALTANPEQPGVSGHMVGETSANALNTLGDVGAAPVRVQLSRKKGWRMPPNTVKVDRSTRYGNPFRVGDVKHFGLAFSGRDEVIETAEHACRLFRRHMFNLRSAAELIAPLRGKNLACWCPLDAPCHADVLLELANAPLKLEQPS